MKELDMYNAAVAGVLAAFGLDCLDGEFCDLRKYNWRLEEEYVCWEINEDEDDEDNYSFSDDLNGSSKPILSKCGGYVGIQAISNGNWVFNIFDLSKCLGGMK